MFDSPKSVTYVAPSEPIDPMQRYLVKIHNLVDMGVSKFAPPDKPYNRIRWEFRIAYLDGTPLLDVDGNPFIHFDYTSSKTTKSKMTSTARTWMEAFLGPLDDSQIDGQITTRLKEKVAVALFEQKDSGGEDGTEAYTRLSIIKLAPFTGLKNAPTQNMQAAAEATASRQAAATKARETVAAARSTSTAVAEDDSPPF